MSKLDELLEVLTKKHVFIQTHNYPDQDAIASAAGLKELLKYKKIEATICYQGQIDKANTMKMVELLNIELYHVSQILMDKDDEIILVDSQKGNVNIEDLIGYEVACIDHHCIMDIAQYSFSDIRSDVGACASIIASYFVENNIPISRETATTLAYGIRMDTHTLARGASDLDIDMFCLLCKNADMDILSRFYFSDITVKDLNSYQRAITNLKINGLIGITRLEENCTEAMLGSISDFILSLAEIEFSIISTRRAGGVKFSVRSVDKNIDASKIIRDALKGIGDGGGHAVMAAGFAPYINDDDVDRVSGFVENKMVELFMRNYDINCCY